MIKCEIAEKAIQEAMEDWLREYTLQIHSQETPKVNPIETALETVRGQLAGLLQQQENICEYLEKRCAADHPGHSAHPGQLPAFYDRREESTVEAGPEKGHRVSLTGGRTVDPTVPEPAATAVCSMRWQVCTNLHFH